MMLDFATVMGNTLTMPDLIQSYEAAESMMLRKVSITLCSYEVFDVQATVHCDTFF